MKIARNSVSLWFDWGQGCAKSVSCTRLCFFMSGLQRRVLVCLFEEACRLLIDDLALKLLLGWEGLLECSAEAVDFLKTVLNCLVSVGCSWELAKQRSAGLACLDPSRWSQGAQNQGFCMKNSMAVAIAYVLFLSECPLRDIIHIQ